MSASKICARRPGRLLPRTTAKMVALSMGIYASALIPIAGHFAATTVPASPKVVHLGAAAATNESTAANGAQMSIYPAPLAPDGTSTVTVRMPNTATSDALHIFLNGADVTAKFGTSTCSDGQCVVANLGPSDGLRQGKNVFQAERKTKTGTAITARARFDGRSAKEIGHQRLAAKPQEKGAINAVQAAPVSVPFIPPTVGIKTFNSGGYKFGQSPWLEIGGANFPSVTPSGCASGNETWTVIVLDRQTLVEKTGAPESSPRCFQTNAAMTTFLKGLPQGDLVIAGSNYGVAPESSAFDTSAIGGTDFNVLGDFFPTSYMIVGVSGATPGSAFEPHSAHGFTASLSWLRGILQEDANGDYNFMAGDGDFVRYAVVPNSPAGKFNHNTDATSSIQISLTGLQKDGNTATNYISYSPPSGSTDGFWLLRLNRGTLERLDNCENIDTSQPGVYYFEGCGKFYPTNTSTHETTSAIAAMKQLASDLQAVASDPWQLLFLTTVGHATCCNQNEAVGIGYGDTGYAELYPVLESLGGTPAYTTYGPGQASSNANFMPAYTLVTASGLGNPLSGPVVESSTVLLNTQGQTGTVSGTLERNNYGGLFTPGQINQEYTNLLIDKGGLDNAFVTNTAALQAPVDWPAESVTQKLQGADSVAGQVDAYRFISVSLLRDRYAVGIVGSHQDDLHFFFTGSLNTAIDYHTFDPINLPWPGSGAAGFTQCSSVNGDTCTYNFESADVNDIFIFTQNDFNAVRAQTSLEVRYLTNVLQFMVTGSTNMRDAIIGGNANVGLALTGAAATVMGNDLIPEAPQQQVTISWQSILGMVNGILTIAAGVPGVTSVLADTTQWAEKEVKAVTAAGAWSNELAGMAGVASGAGSVKSTSTSTPLPSKYSKFALTVGSLASGALQDQLSHGFDAAVDSITSDWGRISKIGPRIVNIDDPAFFTPNQVVQEVVLDAITASAERMFYGQLIPVIGFEVHYWGAVSSSGDGNVNGVQQPDMGYFSEHTQGGTCWAFYLDPHMNDNSGSLGVIPPYVSTYVSRPAGMPTYYAGIASAGTDYYLIAKPSDSPGSDTESITTITADFGSQLFSRQGLNMPMMQFMHPYGPMQSKFKDASNSSDITTHSKSSICGSHDYSALGSVQGVGDKSQVLDPSIIQTQTTLVSPESALIGSSVSLTATVSGGSALVGEGMMYFRIDNKVAASVPVQADGTATYAISSLAFGSHTIKASYGTAAGSRYDASSSDTQTLTVYGDGPDFKVSASANALSVARGSTSSPVTVSVASSNGAAGNVSFACSGLPMGVTCNFAPAQAMISANGSVTTAMAISSIGSSQAAAFGLLGLLFLPLVGLRRMRKSHALALSLLVAVVALTPMTGCSGDKKTYEVPTGTVTVLVSATVGSITRTAPISVTIQ